jgi:predicted nucleotidyltransferase component of viral defense system
MDSSWYSGNTIIPTYHLEELMATKIRALHQRRKGQDLFDLWMVIDKNLIDIDLTIDIFKNITYITMKISIKRILLEASKRNSCIKILKSICNYYSKIA